MGGKTNMETDESQRRKQNVSPEGSPELDLPSNWMTVGNDRGKTEKVERGHSCFAKGWTCQQWEPRDALT